MPGTNDAKRGLRREMRAVRLRAAGVAGRSEAVVARLVAMPEFVGAGVVMLFHPIAGEPDLGAFDEWCRSRGLEVVMPDPDPLAGFPTAPDRVDVVVVPGLAFTRAGHRLGQGGGWYDRFLAGVGPECVTIGVCFDEQLVDDLPAERHDVAVGWVVTPSSTFRAAEGPDRPSRVRP